jgi:hypothetical protein
MNEQILQLFRQAGGTVSVSEDAILTYTDHFDPEKFAELIIRECADVATINQYQPHTAGHYVKKHFGVK